MQNAESVSCPFIDAGSELTIIYGSSESLKYNENIGVIVFKRIVVICYSVSQKTTRKAYALPH